jgi:osmotically-inducible protein OsmY
VPDDRVQVKVENGLVTLSGTVSWQYQKNEAAHAVHKLSGIVGVVNQIRVQPPVPATAVTQQIYKALARDARTEAGRVTVQAENGVVTLKGTVRNWHERELIEGAAWSVPGVSEIRDLLTLRWDE